MGRAPQEDFLGELGPWMGCHIWVVGEEGAPRQWQTSKITLIKKKKRVMPQEGMEALGGWRFASALFAADPSGPWCSRMAAVRE